MESSKNTKIINNLIIHPVTGKVDDSFVGVKIIGNEIHLYSPESYHLSGLDNPLIRDDVIDLIRTIEIAKTTSLDQNIIYKDNDAEAKFALYSYLWLIKDYMANGLFRNREKVIKKNQSGKVNWKRTLQQQPIVSGGNIIYTDIMVDTTFNVDNLLVEIHKYTLKKSIDFVGWIFNLTSNELDVRPINEGLKVYYINAINKELDKTFDDIKRLRLTHMKNVLIGLNVSDSDELVYGVDSYYYVFERMIDSIFGSEKDLKEFNPKAKWYIRRPKYYQLQNSSELRPDTILIDNNIAYILDSKYYRYGYTGDPADLPETTSIQKQITYGDYLNKINEYKKENKVDKIYSAFILPYDMERKIFDNNEKLTYIGYAKADWPNQHKDYHNIYAFLIDLRHVIKVWNRSNHGEDISKLVNAITLANEEVNNVDNIVPVKENL